MITWGNKKLFKSTSGGVPVTLCTLKEFVLWMVFYGCLARSSSLLILQVFILCHCPVTQHFPEYFSFIALKSSRKNGTLPKLFLNNTVRLEKSELTLIRAAAKMPTWCHSQVYMQGRRSSHHNSVQKRCILKSEKYTSPFPYFSQRRVFIDGGILVPIWLLDFKHKFFWLVLAVAKSNLVSVLFDSNLQHSRAYKIDHECSHCELFPKFPTHHTE